jgi:hypothetical protein
MKHFRGRQSRKHYLERRSYLLETWPKINQEILTVKKTGWLHSYDLARQSLERRLPKCHEALLVQLTQVGSTIFREKRVRDLRREELRAGDAAAYIVVSEPVGTLAGPQFLLTSWSVEAAVEDLRGKLERQAERMKEPSNGLFDKALASQVRAFEGLLVRLEKELRLVSALPAFTSRSNVEMVCGWLNETRPDDGHYKTDGRAIELTPFDAASVRWNFLHVGQPELAALLRAVGAR